MTQGVEPSPLAQILAFDPNTQRINSESYKIQRTYSRMSGLDAFIQRIINFFTRGSFSLKDTARAIEQLIPTVQGDRALELLANKVDQIRGVLEIKGKYQDTQEQLENIAALLRGRMTPPASPVEPMSPELAARVELLSERVSQRLLSRRDALSRIEDRHPSKIEGVQAQLEEIALEVGLDTPNLTPESLNASIQDEITHLRGLLTQDVLTPAMAELDRHEADAEVYFEKNKQHRQELSHERTVSLKGYNSLLVNIKSKEEELTATEAALENLMTTTPKIKKGTKSYRNQRDGLKEAALRLKGELSGLQEQLQHFEDNFVRIDDTLRVLEKSERSERKRLEDLRQATVADSRDDRTGIQEEITRLRGFQRTIKKLDRTLTSLNSIPGDLAQLREDCETLRTEMRALKRIQPTAEFVGQLETLNTHIGDRIAELQRLTR
ncbi:MAG: hypothetical protein MRY21_01155 [Simkaniaceae bacterium]|nr:hypothetical protein [Simkaniaceae bacterium]